MTAPALPEEPDSVDQWIALLDDCRRLLEGRAELVLGSDPSQESGNPDGGAEFALSVVDGLTLAVHYRAEARASLLDAVGLSTLIVRAVAEQLEQARTELDAERTRTANLAFALATNRDIGTAIGIVMASESCTREVAFDRLRRQSQNAHRKLRDVAAEVIFTGTLKGRHISS